MILNTLTKTVANPINEVATNASNLWNSIVTISKKYGPQVIYAILIFLIGIWISKIIANLLQKGLNRTKIDKTLSKFLANLIYYTLFVLVLLMALGKLGVQTTSFVAIIGAMGFAVGFALKDSLSHFASGVMILFFKPFSLDDFVEVAGISGTVKEIGIFNTKLATPDNKIIYVPNGSITSGNIINYSKEGKRRVDFTFGVSYDDDIKKVKDTLLNIVKNDNRVLKEPAPFIGLAEFGDTSVNFALRIWTKTENYWDVYFDTMEKVKVEFDKNGISIPYPITDVNLYNKEK